MKPTLREIAQQACVHQSTASCVLNGTLGSTRVSDETRQRVLEVAHRLGYRANRAAQQLRTRRSQVVGLLVGELENPFFARLVSLCIAELEQAGYESVLAMRRQNEQNDLHLLQTLWSRQVDGIVIWSETETQIRHHLQNEVSIFPVVVMGYKMDACDSVEAALDEGVQAAVEHLVEKGCTRIGYLAPEGSGVTPGDPRTDTYNKTLQAANLLPRIYEYKGAAHNPESARERAEEIARENPSTRPDALLCFNDMTAIGALMGLRRKGLRVPHDIALVGCDDLPIARQMDVPLTSIAYPLEALCKSAVAMLVGRIESERSGEDIKTITLPRCHTIPVALSVRESSDVPKRI